MTLENGWGEYKRLVVHELERLNTELSESRANLELVKKDVIELKTKAAVLGAFAGFLVSLLIAVLKLIWR